jgi:hypothetical protein
MICKICKFEAIGKKFSNHLQREHKLKSKDYTARFIYKKRPECEHCNKETRYVAFKFKRFCKDCTPIASSAGGKKGGQAKAWNKGQTKETDTRLRAYSEKVSGDGNHFYGRQHTEETREQISRTKTLNRIAFQKRINERSADFELLTDFDEYFSRQQQHLEFKCKKCNSISKKTLQAFERGSLCQICYPCNRSQFEIEINKHIESLGIKTVFSDRNIISPKELDIVIPDKNIAIEANGLYWHSQNERDNDYDKRRHINKTTDCLKNGYKLIHIFSDEWRDKKEICKSMISNRLGVTPRRVFARKCNIRELTKQEEKEFFKRSHISGFVPSRKCFALIYDDTIISAISLRAPRQKKYEGMLEIARFASLTDYSVVGGLSKLIKFSSTYTKDNGHTGLLTYADRRFGEGSGYLSAGFSLVGNTGIDYWYTDGQIRIDRFSIKTNKQKTEKQQAYDNRLMKVHGCGSNIYLKYF